METKSTQKPIILKRDEDGRIPFYRHDGVQCQWPSLLRALGVEPLIPTCICVVSAQLYAEASVSGCKKPFRLCPTHADVSIEKAIMDALEDRRKERAA